MINCNILFKKGREEKYFCLRRGWKNCYTGDYEVFGYC